MNNEDYVTYDIAVLLKDAGFGWPCYSYYEKWEDTPDGCVWHTTSEKAHNYNRFVLDNGITEVSAPTLAQVQKWLRKRGLCVSVYPSPYSEDIDGEYAYKVYQFMDYEEWNDPCAEYGKDYESALSAGIEAALKLIEDGEDD